MTKPDIPKVKHVTCSLPRQVGICSKRGSQAKMRVNEALLWNFGDMAPACEASCWFPALDPAHQSHVKKPHGEQGEGLYPAPTSSPFLQEIMLTLLSWGPSHQTAMWVSTCHRVPVKGSMPQLFL